MNLKLQKLNGCSDNKKCYLKVNTREKSLHLLGVVLKTSKHAQFNSCRHRLPRKDSRFPRKKITHSNYCMCETYVCSFNINSHSFNLIERMEELEKKFFESD